MMSKLKQDTTTSIKNGRNPDHTAIPIAGKDVAQQELSFVAGGNAKIVQSLWQFGNF